MQNTTETEEIICKCPHCDASLKMHWHRLSPGLVNTLIKFRKKILQLKRNKVHIKDEIEFTKTEFANFQKLRYFGIVAKFKDENGKHEKGNWLLTRNGNLFCKSKLAMPVKVQTFRNKISDKSTELVFIGGITQDDSLEYWDKIENFTYEFADITDMQEIKFDAKGQGLLNLQ